MIKQDVLQFKLKQIGDFIIEEAYPNIGMKELSRYKSYKLKLSEKEYKTRLGSYSTDDKVVEVSSIYDTYFADVVIILLHEIAHHIEVVSNKNSSHDNDFYKTNCRLISTAIDCKLITFGDVIQHTNYSVAQNRNKLTTLMNKYIPSKNKKDINTVFDMSFVSEHNKLKPISEVIKIRCTGKIERYIKARGYTWEENEKVWYKKFHKRPDYNVEINFLLDNGFAELSINHKTYFANELVFIISGNTYAHKETLKTLGYTYTDKTWEKRVAISDYKKELRKVPHTKDIKVNFKYITSAH